MGTLTIQRKVSASPRQVWDVITEWTPPITDPFNRALFARVVDAMAAEAVRTSGQPDSGRQ